MEQKYDSESQRWEDQEALLKKDLAKLRESSAEINRQNDSLKKKYGEEVENLK